MATHRIQAGTCTRLLPVREVKPGVNVALFNPLGDWELQEALGVALAPRIPAGTDILLMPDGKAQESPVSALAWGRLLIGADVALHIYPLFACLGHFFAAARRKL